MVLQRVGHDWRTEQQQLEDWKTLAVGAGCVVKWRPEIPVDFKLFLWDENACGSHGHGASWSIALVFPLKFVASVTLLSKQEVFYNANQWIVNQLTTGWLPLGQSVKKFKLWVCYLLNMGVMSIIVLGLGMLTLLVHWDYLGPTCKDSNLTVLRCVLGEDNGTPLQYSCLENPMDGGAWWAPVHGVAKSGTRLSHFTFNFHFHALEKEMATHSSVLAWRILGLGETGGLPSMGSHRVGHDWSNLAAAAAAAGCVLRISTFYWGMIDLGGLPR